MTKILDSTGQVNNNVVIEEPMSVHNQEMIVLLYIIAAVKLLEFILYVYNGHSRYLKRKYDKQNKINQNGV